MKKKLFSLLLALCMVLTLLPVTAMAEQPQVADEITVSHHAVQLLQTRAEGVSVCRQAKTANAGEYYTEAEDAAAALRSKLEARTASITIPVQIPVGELENTEENFNLLALGVFAMAIDHTGVPTQGDYLLCHINNVVYYVSGTYDTSYYYLNLLYETAYYTTASQEQQLSNTIDVVFNSFSFSESTSDYSKIAAIYRYICDNVSYDNQHLNSDNYPLKYSAYAAMVNGTAVCQGYASLLYRMLLKAGVDTRIILGTSSGENHAWNIAKLGEKYYNLDSTWDAGEAEYTYFLKCPSNFPDHTRNEAYDSDEFHAAYPMALLDFNPGARYVVDSGSCNADISWKLYSDGWLEISGTGAMPDYSTTGTKAPWSKHRGQILHVSVGDGITAVGSCTVTSAPYLETVTLGKDVRSVGASAFNYCRSLHSITLPSVEQIGSGAFTGCSSLTTADLGNRLQVIGSTAFHGTALKEITIPATVTSIGSNAFFGCTRLTAVHITDLSAWCGIRFQNYQANPLVFAENLYLNGTLLLDIEIPDGVASINSWAFQGCSAKTITVPASVTQLGEQIFGPQEYVHFLGDVPSFVKGTLGGFSGIITYPCTNQQWAETVMYKGNGEPVEKLPFHKDGIAGTVTPPTCTTKGYTAYTCSTCSAPYFSDYVDPIPHTESPLPGTPASCTQTGLTDGVECSVCHTVLLRQEEIPCHRFVSGICADCSLPQGLLYTVSGGCVAITGYTGSLSVLTVPASIEGAPVTAIKDGAFSGCESLVSVTLPDSITSLGRYAFSQCKNLVSITLPSALKSILFETFCGCSKLREITIPQGVTTLGSAAFSGCSSLTEITIPASVTLIENNAFAKCSSLKKVIFLGDGPAIGGGTFTQDTLTAFFPCNKIWKATLLQHYNGSVDWQPVHEFSGDSCRLCGYELLGAGDVHRIFGASRYETSIASAEMLKDRMGTDKFPAAIIASGENFADALAGSYLAVYRRAPILLTDNSNVDELMDYIRENVEKGGTIMALGGPTIVSDRFNELADEGYYFDRLAGANRFETNSRINSRTLITEDTPVLVCNAYSFPDSLSASAAGLPILLVDDMLFDFQFNWLVNQGIKHIVIVGGTGAVSSTVETALCATGATVERLAGATRFDTSVMVAQRFYPSAAHAVLTYGYNFPDGLCAGPLAYQIGAPLILTSNGDEETAVNYISTTDISGGYVLGGSPLISDTTANKIFGLD